MRGVPVAVGGHRFHCAEDRLRVADEERVGQIRRGRCRGSGRGAARASGVTSPRTTALRHSVKANIRASEAETARLQRGSSMLRSPHWTLQTHQTVAVLAWSVVTLAATRHELPTIASVIATLPSHECISITLTAGRGRSAGVRVAGQMVRFAGLQPAAHS